MFGGLKWCVRMRAMGCKTKNLRGSRWILRRCSQPEYTKPESWKWTPLGWWFGYWKTTGHRISYIPNLFTKWWNIMPIIRYPNIYQLVKYMLKYHVISPGLLKKSQSNLSHLFWRFPENKGTLKSWMVRMKNPTKIDDLGVPPFLETPISHFLKISSPHEVWPVRHTQVLFQRRSGRRPLGNNDGFMGFTRRFIGNLW